MSVCVCLVFLHYFVWQCVVFSNLHFCCLCIDTVLLWCATHLFIPDDYDRCDKYCELGSKSLQKLLWMCSIKLKMSERPKRASEQMNKCVQHFKNLWAQTLNTIRNHCGIYMYPVSQKYINGSMKLRHCQSKMPFTLLKNTTERTNDRAKWTNHTTKSTNFINELISGSQDIQKWS